MSRLCVHTITTKPLSLGQCLVEYPKRGISGITIWRQALEGRDLAAVKRQTAEAGLELVSLCRGGFFPAATASGRQAAIDDNLTAIAQAHAIGAPLIVLVCGALPGQSLAESRKQIAGGIAAVLPAAEQAGVKLAIEPLHPMYAADRACINTLSQALDLCDLLDPARSGALGVAVDLYHVWWDPLLQQQIERAGNSEMGKSRLLAFHVCDWLTPTTDLLNDRGMMGDGVIDIPRIRSWVEAQGFAGYSEVEIFSAANWWQRDGGQVLDTCVQRHRSCV